MFNIPNSILSVIKAGPDDRVVAMKGDAKITVVDLVKEIERQRTLIERAIDIIEMYSATLPTPSAMQWLKDAELSGNSGEFEECKHIPSGIVIDTYPPIYTCNKCGKGYMEVDAGGVAECAHDKKRMFLDGSGYYCKTCHQEIKVGNEVNK